jgi:CheY-like chemotaxis protein
MEPGEIHASTDPPSASGARILYIDDDEALLELLGGFLQRRGHRVEAFADSAAALDRLRAMPQAFDLVITDYLMPGPSGLVVAREVRAIRADLPVIVVSESVRWDRGWHALDPSVAAAVAKADRAALERAIQRVRTGASPAP